MPSAGGYGNRNMRDPLNREARIQIWNEDHPDQPQRVYDPTAPIPTGAQIKEQVQARREARQEALKQQEATPVVPPTIVGGDTKPALTGSLGGTAVNAGVNVSGSTPVNSTTVVSAPTVPTVPVKIYPIVKSGGGQPSTSPGDNRYFPNPFPTQETGSGAFSGDTASVLPDFPKERVGSVPPPSAVANVPTLTVNQPQSESMSMLPFLLAGGALVAFLMMRKKK